MKRKNLISRRTTIKGIAATGALTVLGSKTAHSQIIIRVISEEKYFKRSPKHRLLIHMNTSWRKKNAFQVPQGYSNAFL